MKKTKIGIYTQRYNFPFNTFILRQINGVRNQFEPVILTSNKSIIQGTPPSYDIYEKEISNSGRIIRGIKKILGDYAALSYSQKNFFYKIINKNEIKLIHAHYGPSGIEIASVAQQLGIPLLVSFHGYDASFLLNNNKYLSQLKNLFKYANVLAVSDYMANKLIKAGADRGKISVIRYGVPVLNEWPKRTPIKVKFNSNQKITFLQISGFK